jgi:hypothetical protein
MQRAIIHRDVQIGRRDADIGMTRRGICSGSEGRWKPFMYAIASIAVVSADKPDRLIDQLSLAPCKRRSTPWRASVGGLEADLARAHEELQTIAADDGTARRTDLQKSVDLAEWRLAETREETARGGRRRPAGRPPVPGRVRC